MAGKLATPVRRTQAAERQETYEDLASAQVTLRRVRQDLDQMERERLRGRARGNTEQDQEDTQRTQASCSHGRPLNWTR